MFESAESAGEFYPEPLTGRVKDWRTGLGRSLYSLFLALSFASVTRGRTWEG
jgi:hypothetical protein